LNRSIEERDYKIYEFSRIIEEKQRLIADLERTIADVKKSFSYKLGRFLTWPLRIFFPVGSKRECLLNVSKAVIKNPVDSIKKVRCRDIKRFFHALRREDPKIVSGNISNYLQKKNIVEDSKDKSFLKFSLKNDESNRKKVIMVIDYSVPSYDQDAGSRTMFQYLKLFVELGYKVVFMPDDFCKTEPYVEDLKKIGVEVLYGDWYANNWHAWMKENNEYIDYIYLNRVCVAIRYIDFIKENLKARVIYNAVDFSFLREKRQFEITKDEKYLKASKESKKYEFHIFEKSDVIVTISEYERKFLHKELPEKQIYVMPTFIYENFLGENGLNFEKRENITFIGGFKHYPNVDGVSWFAKEVLPLVLKYIPDVIFNIIGSNPSADILNLKSKNINVTGYISEGKLKEYYNKSKIIVAPLRFGAGVKGKVIEAIAYGVPVVTTSVGAEGIKDIGGVLSVANKAKDFAKLVVDLYRDHRRWQKIRDIQEQYTKKYLGLDAGKRVWNEILK